MWMLQDIIKDLPQELTRNLRTRSRPAPGKGMCMWEGESEREREIGLAIDSIGI